MILFIHSFQVLNTLSYMVLTAVNADVGGHFNLVIGLLVFRRRRYKVSLCKMCHYAKCVTRHDVSLCKMCHCQNVSLFIVCHYA